MPDQAQLDHDMLRDHEGRIKSVEGRIDGIVPERCIEQSQLMSFIKDDLAAIKNNVSKLIWAIIIAAIATGANLIADNIRWGRPASSGAAHAQSIQRGR